LQKYTSGFTLGNKHENHTGNNTKTAYHIAVTWFECFGWSHL